MDDENKELSAEIKLKLLQVEKDAEKHNIPRSKIFKSALSGMVALAVIPFFGIMRFEIWQVMLFSLIFGAAGFGLFAMAAICRSNKK